LNKEIIADILIFGGIFTTGLGIWLYMPWIALTVVGLMLGGLGVASFFIRK
jgi:hypothetical protein